MAEARTRQAWAQTSAVMALVANVHRDPKKTPALKPDDFNPLAKNRVPAPRADVSLLKQVFIDSRPGDHHAQ